MSENSAPLPTGGALAWEVARRLPRRLARKVWGPRFVLLVALAIGALVLFGGTAVLNAPSQADVAVQQAIQRGDEEQAQAFAQQDPSVMQDTATSTYYRQLVQTNQDLAANGVSAIKLVKIEWGPIDVTGDIATATAYETWRTTLVDGTTEQNRDRNVYTLVQDNGAWKIQADDHPDDQTPAPGAGPGG